MALPVILVDSATGSDSAASGAGPATALTGAAGISDGAGTTVTLDGSPDLTNVATDGSHVLYFADATAGNRNFGKITAKGNSGTPTAFVTVANAFGLTLTKAWAIGGKRASIASATSIKLFSNNAAAGDAMPGWIVEMQSAHAESISAAIDMRRAGDATSGAIIFRGAAGAATMPKITATANINCIVMRAAYIQLKDFNIEAASAAVSTAVIQTVSGPFRLEGLKLTRTSTNVFTTGIDLNTNAGDGSIIGCEISRCGVGIKTSDTCTVLNNYIHDCTSHGISWPSLAVGFLGVLIHGNIIAACGGDGINTAFTGTVTRSITISCNTIDACTGDGIEFTAAPSDGLENVRIFNNILSNNGGYGINFSDAGSTLIALQSRGMIVKNNDTYNNTSGAYLPASLGENDPGLDPQYTNAAGGDYSIGTNLKAKGYPIGGTLTIGKTSATNSYTDIGAAQRQEAGGGIAVLTGGGMVR